MARFCTNCGKEVDEQADICIKCGKIIEKQEQKKIMKKNNKIGALGIALIIIGSVVYLFLTMLIFIVAILDIDEDSYYYEDEYHNELYHDITNNEGTINDILKYKQLEFELNKATTHEYIELNDEKIKPKNGYEYLVLNFEVKNNSSFDYNLDINNFIGYENGIEMKKINIEPIDDNKLLNDIIKENMSIKGNVVFEVRKGWYNFELIYKENNSKERITYRIYEKDMYTQKKNYDKKAEF